MPRNSETKFNEDLTPEQGSSSRSTRQLFRRWAAATAVLAGAAALSATVTSPAAANYPDPPGLVRSLAAETAPATCPTWAPAGTFPAGTNVKTLCERAVAKAPTAAAAAAIRYMFDNLGAEYDQGNRFSVNPPVYDCTSFVARAYTAAGAKIVKGTRETTWISTFGWTGAYMPSAYEGTNLNRLAVAPGDLSSLLPGDVLIQFSGSTPAGSAGNNGHAQVYIGDGLIIQSGGNHPQSLSNVTRHSNYFSNEWVFRYGSAATTDPFYSKWVELGGASGIAGNPIGPVETNSRGGLTRRYERANMYWSASTGAKVVYGGVLGTYAALGYETSPLGLPTTDETDRAVPGSRGNNFQGGVILWSPTTGSHAVYGAIGARYAAIGHERSPLGLPVTGERDGPFPGTRISSFQNGAIIWAPASGAYELHGAISKYYYNPERVQNLGVPTSPPTASKIPGLTVQQFQRGMMYAGSTGDPIEVYGGIASLYRAMGAESSALGQPLSPERPGAVSGSRVQSFRGGAIYYSPATGVHAVYGGIGARYAAMGGERSSLGLPTSGEQEGPIPGTRMNTFQKGRIVWSPSTGAYELVGATDKLFMQTRVMQGLGLPVSAQIPSAVAGLTVQNFQRGAVYSKPGFPLFEVYGGIYAAYRALGAEKGTLGPPLSGEFDGPTEGSRMNTFTNGAVIWSPSTGMNAVAGGIWERYQAILETSPLGLPVAPEVKGAAAGVTTQRFQGGIIYSTPSTTMEVYGPMLAGYQALGAELSPLGAPVSAERDGVLPGSRVQAFSNGTMYWSAATGAHGVYGTIAKRYEANGGVKALGLPTSPVESVGKVQSQEFQRGAIVATGTVTLEVVGEIGTRYVSLGGDRSPLGLPTGQETATSLAGVTMQPFQGGAIYRSASGVWEVYGGIWGAYRALGAEKSGLGQPTSGEIAGPLPGSRMNTFANGVVVWSGPTGAQPIFGAMWEKYNSAKLAATIGLPRDIPRGAGVAGAAVQEFQRGTIYWSAATGAHEVYGGIGSLYRNLGGAKSRLGLPTSGEYSITNGRANNFQGGQIVWDSRTGMTQVKFK